TALVQTQEAADALRHHSDTLEIDPQRFAEVGERLETLRDVVRKHQIAPKRLAELREQLSTELAEMEHASEHLTQLRADQQKQIAAYESAAKVLTAARKQAAKPLAQAINDIIHTLGMPEARLAIHIDADGRDAYPPAGRDRVEFRI